MTITIKPFTVNLNDRSISSLLACDKEEYVRWVVYWGVYLNNEQISYTSTKQLAEQTKIWMEKWLESGIHQIPNVLMPG